MTNVTATKVDIREAFAIAELGNVQANGNSVGTYSAQLINLTASGIPFACGFVTVKQGNDLHNDYIVSLYSNDWKPAITSIIPEASATAESIAETIKLNVRIRLR